MASVVRRVRKDGTPSYFVKFRAGDARVRWERFGKAKDAHARRAEVELALSRSGHTWTPARPRTLGEVADDWIARAEERLAERTLHNYRCTLKAHLRPAFGARPVAGIRRSEVEDFAATLARRGMAPGSIGQVIGLLRQILGVLVQDGELERNAARAIGVYGTKRKRHTPPSEEQLESLLEALAAQARPVVELAAGSGLRRGECFRLTWEDVNFETREIAVRSSKTDAGERIVPMFGSVRKLLLEQKARSRFTRPDDLVFPTVVSTPENAQAWIGREFLPAIKRAGLERAFRFHDLRHYAVSRLVEQGANILLVSRVAGHTRPSITLDVYSHLFKEGLAEAALRFDPMRSAPSRIKAVDGG